MVEITAQTALALMRNDYKLVCRAMWEIENYDKVGADIDASKYEALSIEAAKLESKLDLPAREVNLI